MNGKSLFGKIKGNIWNIPIEASNKCNILQRPTISNGLIVFKLKRDLKHMDHVYFEPVGPHIIYQTLTDLKLHNKYYENISIGEGLSSKYISSFSDNVESQGKNESATDKNILICLSLKFPKHVQNFIKQDNSCVSESEYN